MKPTQKYILSLLALLLCQAPARADNTCCTSHQYVPRTLSSDLAYTNLLNFYDRHRDRDERQKIIYAGTFLYQQSKKSEELGSAFLLGGSNCPSNCINVAQNGTSNVNSFWLGLSNADPANPFVSRYCIEPERTTLGYYGYFFFDLSDWLCGLWFDAGSAIANVRHDLNCCEQGNTASATPGITTVTQALNNPAYLYGKFNCSDCEIDRHRTGVDDIQLRLGYERSWCDDRMIGDIYIIGTIPTGDLMNAEYIFQPVVGTRHGSIGIGAQADYDLWCNACGDRDLALLFDANYRYAFKSKERRTFDLCPNGQFSRFLEVVQSTATATPLPGVNYFTQNVEVTPRSTVQAWLALHYKHCRYDLEIGYNFFWRQQEKLGCACPIAENIGIYQLGCERGCTSASTATIAQGPTQVVADAAFVALTQNNLNLNSAAGGKALSNKFYIAGEINGCSRECLDWFAAIGGSYEFVNGQYRCTTLPVGAFFAKFGLIF